MSSISIRNESGDVVMSYREVQEFNTCTVALSRSIHDFAQSLLSVEGTCPFSEQSLLLVDRICHSSGQESSPMVGVSMYEGTTLIGVFLALNIEGTQLLIEGGVHPQYRGQGLGSALTQKLFERIDADYPHYTLVAWAHQVRAEQGQQLIERSTHLAQRHGLEPVRRLHQLEFELTPSSRQQLSELVQHNPISAEYTVRPFIPGTDNQQWLELNAQAFAQHPEQGSLTAEDLAQRLHADWFNAEGFLLLETIQPLEDGQKQTPQLAGFHWTKIPAGQEHQKLREGEVYVLAISPEHQGKNLGKALLFEGMNYLAQVRLKDGSSLNRIILYVDEENHAAWNLYRQIGFESLSTDIMYAITAH
ncbi:mycothiol synthase [Rothia sp. P13129]|uniref:mycothiol synthase n=1 Tax=Rothia sp. P13129 TaxID=3402664 RepID=UPI003AD290FA